MNNTKPQMAKGILLSSYSLSTCVENASQKGLVQPLYLVSGSMFETVDTEHSCGSSALDTEAPEHTSRKPFVPSWPRSQSPTLGKVQKQSNGLKMLI